MQEPDPSQIVDHLSRICDDLRVIADAADRIQLTLLDAGLITPVVEPSYEVVRERFFRCLEDDDE